jgi:hypothetical protein
MEKEEMPKALMIVLLMLLHSTYSRYLLPLTTISGWRLKQESIGRVLKGTKTSYLQKVTLRFFFFFFKKKKKTHKSYNNQNN